MLNLMFKDLRRLFATKGKLSHRIFTTLVKIISVAIFVAVESYIYYQVVSNISKFEGAVVAFSSLFLFVLSLIMVVMDLFQAEKLFFDEKDAFYLSKLPITKGKIVVSKLILLFFLHYGMTLVLVYPILVSYGIYKTAIPFYYILGLLYPLITFFFEGGIALALVYPFHRLKARLMKSPLTMFVISVVLMAVFAIIYGWILNMFISLVANQGVNSFLTEESMGVLSAARKYFVIATYLVDTFFLNASRSLITAIFISLVAFVVGMVILLIFYGRRPAVHDNKKPAKPLSHKEHSPFFALVKKEALILFRDADGLFGYTGLLIVQPYLCYLVCFALNTLFTTGAIAYDMAMFPGFATVVLLFTYLFFVAVTSFGANDYLTREGNALRIGKTIPVSPWVQTAAKILTPFLASFLSLLVTVVVLMATGLLAPTTGLLALAMAILFLSLLVLLQFREEMKRKPGAVTSRFVSTTLSYALPISLLGLGLLFGYLGWSVTLLCGLFLGLEAVLLIPYTIRFMLRLNRSWAAMEVSS